MKVFVDVDNTILEHTNFYDKETEGRIHKIFGTDPESNYKAIKTMYETAVCSDQKNIKKLFKRDDFYILTKTSNDIYEHYKRVRVAEILNITVDEMIAATDSQGNRKYLSIDQEIVKADFIKETFKVNNLEDYILIDDYSQNLVEWELENGTGIKFYNEYNSSNHPIGGLVISNFKLFEFFESNTKIKNLVCGSFLKDYFKREFSYANYVNFLKILKRDIIERFSITDNEYETKKQSYSSFLKEYYYFTIDHNFEDIQKHFIELYDPAKLNIIVNPFDYEKSDIIKITGNKQLLSVGYTTDRDTMSLHDVYISIPKNEFSDFTYQKITSVMRFLRSLHDQLESEE